MHRPDKAKQSSYQLAQCVVKDLSFFKKNACFWMTLLKSDPDQLHFNLGTKRLHVGPLHCCTSVIVWPQACNRSECCSVWSPTAIQ